MECSECGREFKDNRGLGAHKRAAHGIAGMSKTAKVTRQKKRKKRKKRVAIEVKAKVVQRPNFCYSCGADLFADQMESNFCRMCGVAVA